MSKILDLRDRWCAEMRAEADRLNKPEPEPWAEIAYMHWHLMRSDVPVIEVEPERTWIWSDLHLGDAAYVITGRRPYRNTSAMNRALLAAWRSAVRPNDTIICLGDVAHPDYWRDPRNTNDVKGCPGRRLLVMGNHDIGQADNLQRAGFVHRRWAIILDTEPPAALTHAPLKHRPLPAVNIHGHWHGFADESPRHANVTVECTGYVPVRLSSVLERLKNPLPL